MKKVSVNNMIAVLKSKYNLDFSNLTFKDFRIKAGEKYRIDADESIQKEAYALDIVADIKELMMEKIERDWYRKEERVFYINTLLEEFFKVSGFIIRPAKNININ